MKLFSSLLSATLSALFLSAPAALAGTPDTPSAPEGNAPQVRWACNMPLNVMFNYGFAGHHSRPMSTKILANYEFTPRLYVLFGPEVEWLHHTDTRTYSRSVLLQGGLGVRLLGGRQAFYEGPQRHLLDLRLAAGGSVGKADCKQVVYDAGLVYSAGGTGKSPMFGLGYRFSHARSASQPDLHVVYLSVGLRL